MFLSMFRFSNIVVTSSDTPFVWEFMIAELFLFTSVHSIFVSLYLSFFFFFSTATLIIQFSSYYMLIEQFSYDVSRFI